MGGAGAGLVEVAWPALRQLLPALQSPHLVGPTMWAAEPIDDMTPVSSCCILSCGTPA